MRAGGELAGTVEYAGGWLWLALGLLVAVLVWNLGLVVWGRPHRVRSEPVVEVDPAEVRTRYAARIDALDAARVAGRLDDRAAHRELSLVCRGFVEELTGLGATALTLADLRGRDVPVLVDVVERTYPVEFSARDDWPSESWADAVAHAREVVGAPWN